jgi:PEP-CTERM motif
MKALRLAAFALIAVAASATSMATVYPLGNFTVPGIKSIGASYTSAGTFTDEYTFSFVEPIADPIGISAAFNIGLPGSSNLTIDSVVLKQGATVLGSFVGPGIFNFSSITNGSYSLFVQSTVSGTGPFFSGYGGNLQLVPEPGTLALFGLGLAGAAFAARRGKAVRAA